jgi:hypothetical protein
MQAAPGTSYVSNVVFDPQINDMVFHVAVSILDDTRRSPSASSTSSSAAIS